MIELSERGRRLWWKIVPIWIGAALACNAPLLGNPDEIPLTLTAGATVDAVIDVPPSSTPPPAMTASLTPLPTEVPESTNNPDCGYAAVYVDDVTVPDNTEIAAGDMFTKTWRLENVGCADWPAGTQLLFVEGDQMGGPSGVLVPTTRPGEVLDVSVDLVAPLEPGEYQGFWRMRSGDGVVFGEQIYVLITVVPPANTTAPASSGDLPDLSIDSISYSHSPPVTGETISIEVTVINHGDGEASASILRGTFEGNDTPIETKAIPKLAPGASYTATFEIEYDTANSYEIVFTADANDDNVEEDETNNQAGGDVEFVEPE